MDYNIMRKLEEKMIDELILSKYVLGNIDEIIIAINSKNVKTISEGITSEYEEFLGKVLGKLKIIVELLYTKKLQENKKDFIKLGEEIHKIADIMVGYGNLYENDSPEKSTDNTKEKMEEKMKEILNKIFN